MIHNISDGVSKDILIIDEIEFPIIEISIRIVKLLFEELNIDMS